MSPLLDPPIPRGYCEHGIANYTPDSCALSAVPLLDIARPILSNALPQNAASRAVRQAQLGSRRVYVPVLRRTCRLGFRLQIGDSLTHTTGYILRVESDTGFPLHHQYPYQR